MRWIAITNSSLYYSWRCSRCIFALHLHFAYGPSNREVPATSTRIFLWRRHPDRMRKPSIRRILINAIGFNLDRQFLSPAVAAVANQQPASITNALTPSGVDGWHQCDCDGFEHDAGVKSTRIAGI